MSKTYLLLITWRYMFWSVVRISVQSASGPCV